MRGNCKSSRKPFQNTSLDGFRMLLESMGIGEPGDCMTGVLVHEWIAATGGAEKVLDSLARAFPQADLQCLWTDALDRFQDRPVHETWLARSPLRRSKAAALPFMLGDASEWHVAQNLTNQLLHSPVYRVLVSLGYAVLTIFAVALLSITYGFFTELREESASPPA